MFETNDFTIPFSDEEYLKTIPMPAARSVREKKVQNYLEVDLAKTIKEAYYATTSFVDAQIGRVLDKLEETGLDKNTIVILTSDHGYHLGEKHHWNKHALWEKTTHVPLMFSFPGQNAVEYQCVVSLLVVFPTIIDALNLPKLDHLEGQSLLQIMFTENAIWDNHALTTMDYKNHSVRGICWRYTKYKDGSEELYDKKFDPNEFFNLAEYKSLKRVKKRLRGFLPEDNHKALPEEVFVH